MDASDNIKDSGDLAEDDLPDVEKSSPGSSKGSDSSAKDRYTVPSALAISELPSELLQHMMTLQAHTLYFLGDHTQRPPDSLIRLLNDVSGAARDHGIFLDSRAKKEVLADDRGRKVRVLPDGICL